MSVYVDSPVKYVTDIKYKTFSHMWADTVAELHVMADKIGLKREWFQAQPEHTIAHYDVVPTKRTLAIKNGAIARELEARDFPRLRRLQGAKI